MSQLEQSVRITQRAAQGEIGQLTIGFEGSFHNETVLSIIREFRRCFTDVELILQEMSSGQQINALQQQQIDVGFVDPIINREDIAFIKLLSEPLVAVLATSHPLAGQDPLDLAQLAKESWITGRADKGCGLLMRVLEICLQAGFTPNIQQETNDIQMTLGMVASGLGVTLLPISALAFKHNEITYGSINSPIAQVELAVAWQRNNSSSVLKAFLGHVHSMF